MNHFFALALQFLLKRSDIPLGSNLLPVVMFLLDEAGSRGYFEMSEKVSSVPPCEGFSTDSPFGEISLQTLSERWCRFLNDAGEVCPVKVNPLEVPWEVIPFDFTLPSKGDSEMRE